MPSHTTWTFAGLVLAAALAGCAGEDASVGDAIRLEDNRFDPELASANAGDTLTFRNVGNNAHTVTVHRPPDATSQFVKDATLNPGDETTLTLDATGVYHIFCRFHSDGASGDYGAGMTMQVNVA